VRIAGQKKQEDDRAWWHIERREKEIMIIIINIEYVYSSKAEAKRDQKTKTPQ